MWVRGAPLIGATAAYGLALQSPRTMPRRRARATAPSCCAAARPTAVNLAWAMRACAARAAPAGAAGARAMRPGPKPMPSPRRTSPSTSAIGDHGLALLRAIAARRPAPVQRADALQRRLAGHRRLGHRDWRRCTRRTAAGIAAARLGRRDAAAQPGRQPDRLGAGAAGRAAHADRRQRRRPPDAARRGRPRHRRLRPRQRATAMSATRSAPT